MWFPVVPAVFVAVVLFETANVARCLDVDDDLSSSIVVDLPKLGSICGTRNVSLWTKRTIFQFQGIPYAKPPSGKLRFREPVKAEPWSGTLYATKFKRKCPQALVEEDMFEVNRTQNTEDLEDCLYLNVYTTQKPTQCSKLFPVMFWIHGGSFRVGSAQAFRPNHLLEQDVVLVTIQYRLGPFGFLSLDDENIAGNMGLLDMVMALEWTRDNIDEFCGNSKQITIFGQSAGGAAVSLMMASPLTKGLFQRAIVQSGSALCDWAVDRKAAEHGKDIARELKCVGDNRQIFECLKNVSVSDILMAHSTFTVIDKANAISKYHEITVDGGNHAVVQIAGERKFLTTDPKEIYAKGNIHRVPTMIGFTKHEGTMILGNIYDFILGRNLTEGSKAIQNRYTEAALTFSGVKDPTGAIADVFNEHYFKRSELGNFTAMMPGLVDICGLFVLKACIFQQAKRTYKLSNTYAYTFHYQGHISKWGYNQGLTYPFPGGVAHSDELVYLFPSDSGNLTDKEKAMAKVIVELWTNFAIYGKPTPATGIADWPKMSHQHGPYLRIKTHSEVRENILDENTIAVQEGVYEYPPPDVVFGEGANPRYTFGTTLFHLALIFTFLIFLR